MRRVNIILIALWCMVASPIRNTQAASNCFELISESPDPHTQRYEKRTIYAVNERADGLELVDVFVDTPRCTTWAFRGCTLVCVAKPAMCAYRCYTEYIGTTHYVYDRSPVLVSSAPITKKIFECYLRAFQFCPPTLFR